MKPALGSRTRRREKPWKARPGLRFAALLVLAAVLALPAAALGQQPENEPAVVWKFATVAPKGVGYAKQIKHLVLPVVERATDGQVSIKVYWGGVMGDDQDIIRKMRFGHLNGAGLSGYGVTILCPEMAVVELPFLFNDYGEVDHIKEMMRPAFTFFMAKSQVYLLAWIDQGFDQIFSSKYPMTTLEDFRKAKFMTWHGPLEEALLESLGAKPLPVRSTQMPSMMAEGLADAMIAPAIFVVGSQMFTTVKYMNPVKIRYSPAVVVLRIQDWMNLPEKYKREYFEQRESLEQAFMEEVRKDNRRFLIALKKYGVEERRMSPDELEVLREKTRPLWNKLAGRLYPQELLDKLLGHLEEYRAREKAGKQDQ